MLTSVYLVFHICFKYFLRYEKAEGRILLFECIKVCLKRGALSVSYFIGINPQVTHVKG